jgi:hypothetical protein
VILGFALLAKKTTMCLLPGAAGALAIAWWAGTMDVAGAVRRGLRIFVPAAVIVAPLLIHDTLLYGDPMTVETERRTMPFLVLDRALSDPYFRTELPRLLSASFVGLFGWMNVWLPRPVYGLYAALALAAVAGLAVRVARNGRDRVVLAVALLFVAACLGGIVHYNRAFPQPQGRFLFVVLPFLAALAAAGLEQVARQTRLGVDRLWWTLAGVLLVVDLTALVTVRRFFAGG